MNETADRSEAASTPQPTDTLVDVESAGHLTALVGGHQVVLVEFYADWCTPCRVLEPTVERLAAETDATVARVDIGELRGLAHEYEVQGVPTFLLFVDGERTERVVGLREESTLRNLVTTA